MNLSGAPIGRNANMGGSMFQRSGFTPVMGSPLQKTGLGEDEQKWFTRAKAAAATYDDLWRQAQLIANSTYRGQLASKYHTKPEDQSGTLFLRNSLMYKLSEAESFTPVNYQAFGQSAVQDKVTKLEDSNSDFKKDVDYGSQVYGLLSAPEATGQTSAGQTSATQPATTTTPTEVPGWLLPAGIGLGVLIIGALLLGGD